MALTPIDNPKNGGGGFKTRGDEKSQSSVISQHNSHTHISSKQFGRNSNFVSEVLWINPLYEIHQFNERNWNSLLYMNYWGSRQILQKKSDSPGNCNSMNQQDSNCSEMYSQIECIQVRSETFNENWVSLFMIYVLIISVFSVILMRSVDMERTLLSPAKLKMESSVK